MQKINLEGTSTPCQSSNEALVTISECQCVADITNQNEYTIEEAKQKAEQDALNAAAEAKKMSVRDHLLNIRKEFEALLVENQVNDESRNCSVQSHLNRVFSTHFCRLVLKLRDYQDLNLR